MVANVIAVANGKGGVGKTSIAVNLAGLMALSGWRVLVVDLDRQGNLGDDLGYRADERNDEGRALLEAVVEGAPFDPPLRGVREGLDAIPAGRYTGWVEQVLPRNRPDYHTALADALAPLAIGYNAVVLDCPPAGGVMSDLALGSARGLVVPVRSDLGSLQGLGVLSEQYRTARKTNPELDLLGVALFAVGSTARSVRKEARETITTVLEGIAPVFDTVIRYAERAAKDMRESGKLAHEYETQARGAAARRLELLHRRTAPLERHHFSSSAPGLAEDYAALCQEIVDRFTAAVAA
ncbi:MAG: ParA family protein [Actinomycetota bacterium]|nr:ParA family protein [Actinomycetota bacterium]